MVSALRGRWWYRWSTLCRFTTVDISSNHITNWSSIHSRPDGRWKHRRARRYSQVKSLSYEFCRLTVVVSIVAERWTKINTIISLLHIICSLRKFSVIVSVTKWRTTIEVSNVSAVFNPPAIRSMNKLGCSCPQLLPSKCPRSEDTFCYVKMQLMALVVRLVGVQNFIREMIHLASISRMSPCRWLGTIRWRLMIWMMMCLSCWICKPTRSTRGDQYSYATLGSGSFPSVFRVFHASKKHSCSLIVIHMPFVSSPGKENLPPVLTTPRHSIDSSSEQLLPGNE